MDDIANGVDEIAFDTKTGFPVGVIDVTTSIGSKDHNLDIRMRIGGKLDFGLEMSFNKDGKASVVPTPLSELPLYVFEMRLDNIIAVARAKATGNYEEETLQMIKSLEAATLSNFMANSQRILSDKTLSETMRVKYQEAHKIFEEIYRNL